MKWDFNSSDPSARINWRIEQGLQACRAKQPSRNYLGASIIGKECDRAIQYSYTGAEQDKPHSGRTLLIFERGHKLETVAKCALEKAGFKFNYNIIGFRDGDFGGHEDGVIVKAQIGIEVPCVWEHKGLGSKGWKTVEKDGVREAYPGYYAQIQIYQKMLNLINPALFTATNADTMDMYHEFVEYDSRFAQSVYDKAMRIIKETAAGKLSPRFYTSKDELACKWCDYTNRCWAEGWVND